MSLLDLDAFKAAPLQHDPCDFIVVPHFVKAEALAAVNRDYPAIEAPGNFEPEDVSYGPVFAELLKELHDPTLKQAFAEKFGMDLSPYPLQLTVRKFAETEDGNVHNDSKTKIVTVLIYTNETWDNPAGRLRLLRNPDDLNSYAAEVPPVDGTLLAFRRNEKSYHGFPAYAGERRSIQMYWVSPKRAERGEKKLTLKKRLKRLLKIRKR